MKKITDLAEKYDMLPPGSLILCAVSGGKDSMYLLEALWQLAQDKGFKIACAHFNHRLRGAESDSDALFVQDWCRGKGIPFYLGDGDVAGFARENGMSTETAARQLRYAFLEKTAEECGAERIATAHTADDNAETVLLNLARGSGGRGMSGIPPVRGKIVRPLLSTTREEIERYLEENGIPNVEDSTNETDDYSRNRLRHHAVPVLRQINSNFSENASRMALLLREDEEYLTAQAQRFIDENASDGQVRAEQLLELPHPISARVLRLMAGADISALHVQALLELCASTDVHAALDIPGMRVIREYDMLIFSPPGAAKIEPAEIKPGETVCLREQGLQITCSRPEIYEEINKSFNIFFFKCESICGSMMITCRTEGDRIRLYGRNVTKSLKKLFSEAKIPQSERSCVPVLRDGAGVLGVYGFGTDERAAPLPGDKVFKIEINKI